MFLGGLLLLAAVITWGTSFLMSPHGETVARGTEHVRTTIVVFMRNSAIGTLVLCALAGWLLYPSRRPRWPARDWAIGILIALLVASSIYDLVWLQTSVFH
jgi:drug/metabolite transporter (DMT)-like permease